MKYIFEYNDLLIEDLLNEAISISLSDIKDKIKDFRLDKLKDLINKKKQLVPIDFDKIYDEAKTKGKVINVSPVKKSINTKDFIFYEKELEKKLKSKIKTPKDANTYYKKVLDTGYDYTSKIIMGTIILTLFAATFGNKFRFDEKIATNIESKNIIHELNIEVEKIYSDNKFKPVDMEEVTLGGISKELRMLMDSIALRESGGNINIINKYGYMGKYQFGEGTLRAVGYGHITSKEFSEKGSSIWSEEQQDDAMVKLLRRNKHILRHHIKRYDGKIVNGKKVTESGMLAGAHLKGAGAVKDYLDSNGEIDGKDGFGTKVSSYINRFSGYKLPYLKPLKSRPASIKNN